MKFASVQYSKNNIGDVIQVIAASRFVPKVDAWCNRENLDQCRFPEPHKIILNGWYQHRTGHFHNDGNLIPLIISMHVAPSKAKSFFTPKVLSFLKRNEPVGCRDTYTLRLMENNGVKAYFSGCLTLTLEPNSVLRKKGYVLCVDVPSAVTEKIQKSTDRPVFELNPMWRACCTFNERVEHAKIYLKKMQEAHVVVTRRLHCALPAIALGTPVVFIADLSYNTVRERCSDYLSLMQTFSESEFCSSSVNLEELSHGAGFERIKSDLIRRCSDFTEFDNADSLIPGGSDDNDVFTLLRAMQKENDEIRELRWLSNKRLVSLFSRRLFSSKRWWNIVD